MKHNMFHNVMYPIPICKKVLYTELG